MKHEKLFARIESPNLDALIEDWRWLIPVDNWTFVDITAMGDLIIKNDNNEYFFLDTIEAKFFIIAKDREEYQVLPQNKEFRRKYLQYYLVLNMVENNIHLSQNECYSPDIPPVLGGELDENNLKPTDIYVHFSISGQILNQTKDLEPGTKINNVQIGYPKTNLISKLKNLFKKK
jgi:hypothetical protein